MAITAERLMVDVDADISGAQRGLAQVSGKGPGGLGGMAMMAGAAKAAMVGMAATAGAAIVTKTVMAASDLNEQLSKAGVVFGPQAKTVTDWASKMAADFGLPKTQLLEAASGIGLVGKASGLTKKAAADMGTELASMAADASSFYNVPLEEALAAIQSGLVGEAEPMRRFGVLLSENAVKAEAQRLGLKAVNGELTEGQKAQARASLIMKGMSDASGDLARTQDSVANRLRELQGRATNAAAALGTALLPAASALLGGIITLGRWIGDMAGKFREWWSSSQPVQDGLTRIGAAVGQAQGFIQQMIPVVQAWVAEFAARALPVIKQIAAYVTGQLIPAVVAFARMVAANVVPIIQSFAAFLTGTLVPAFTQMWSHVAARLVPVFQQLVATFRADVLPTVQVLLTKFREWQPTIQTIIGKVVQVTSTLVRFAADVLGTVLPPVIRFAGFLISNLVPAIANVIGFVVRIIAKVAAFAAAFTEAAVAVAKFAGDVVAKVAQVVAAVVGLHLKVAGALKGAVTWLVSAGKDIVQGLINGITEKAQDAVDAVKNLGGKIKDGFTGFFQINSPSRVMQQLGQYVGDGLVQGLVGTEQQITDTLGGLLDKVDAKLGDTKTKVDDRIRQLVKAAQGPLNRLAAEAEATKGAFDQMAGATGGVDLSNMGKVTAEDGSTSVTGAQLIADLKARTAAAAQFAADIATLKAQGLNDAAIADLSARGAEAAGATARALVEGGKATVDQVNALEAQLQASGVKVAQVGSAAFYDAGQQAAAGLRKGFEDQQEALDAAMTRIAKRLRKQIRKELGIKSPSRVFAEIGRYSGDGLVQGLADSVRPVERMASVLASAATPAPVGQRSGWQPGNVPPGGWDTPAPGAGGVGEVHFHDASLSPAEQAAALTWALTVKGR